MTFFRKLFGGWRSEASTQPEPATKAEEARDTEVAAPIEPSHSYSSDHPISKPAEDRFGRWPFARRIAETLARRGDPSSVVVGIYGPWGDGKTSVLGLMETALAEHNNVVTVRFNPWFFNSQESLLRGFFDTLADALGRRLTTRAEDAGELLKKYGGILSVASVGTISGEGVKSLAEGLSTVVLQTLRVRLEGLLRSAEIRMVVMIDDIDRLDRDDIHAIFKLVKLSAGFKHTSYVLAFDDEVVADSLGSRYGSGGAEAGRSYLEKIVQVPLHLPTADDAELRNLAFSGVDAALNESGISLSKADAQKFGRHFVDGIGPRLQTPRQAKLFVNAVTFALPLLKGEVNPVDQMLIEGIRVFYPKLYAVIRENPDRFLKQGRDLSGDTGRAGVDTQIDAALAGLTADEREQVKADLLEPLFPRFGNTGYGSDWEQSWARDKRICSSEYFTRYFSYTVPAGDISDQVVEGFTKLAAQAPAEQVTQFLEQVARRRAIAKLIRKLRDREKDLDPALAPALAEAILANGSLYPRQQQMLVSDWEFVQAAIFAVAMIRRLPIGEERWALALRLMRIAEPLGLAAQFLRFARHDDETPEASRFLSDQEEREIAALLATRIGSEAATKPLYRAVPDDARHLLWIWSEYGNPDEAKRHIAASLTSADEALAFLGIFVGTAWDMASGLQAQADFRRDAYDSVACYVDPQHIMDMLRKAFGDPLDDPLYHHPDETPPRTVLSHQFAYIHRGAAAEGKAGTQASAPTEQDDSHAEG